MAAAITDKFTEATNGTRPSPTTLTAIHTIGGTTMTVGALTGWPTATAVHFIIYTITTAGLKVAGSQTDWKGVASGTTITGCVLKAGTDPGYSIGAIVECAPTAAWADDVVDGILLHANQDGSLIGSAVRTALNQTATVGAGWTTLGSTLNTVTANGNRSYTLVFNGVDLTPTLSPGMRLQLTRTVTAPTQCTSLNGTTQYFSKSTPAGTTFTDTPTLMGWVKLTAYGTTNVIVSRKATGTAAGWELLINSTGQVQIRAGNTAANLDDMTSIQSIPLNKWVHVAGVITMSTSASTFIYIDGISVPGTFTNGTSTTIAQSGNLAVGANNDGSNFFTGKLAQVAYFSAAIAQATIQSYISQGLSGSETSLVSAYNFNNSIADLNANANNLTAQGSAVATNVDSPFAGGSSASTANTAGTTEFAIVQTIAFSTNTTVVVQVPIGYAIPTSGGVSSVSYSAFKVPVAFPADQGLWTVSFLGRSNVSQASPTSTTWYNLGSISLNVPIGAWRLGYNVGLRGDTSVQGNLEILTTLSTTAATETDLNFSTYALSGSVAQLFETLAMKEDFVTVAAATPYYLNGQVRGGSLTNLNFGGTLNATIIRAVNNYI